MKSFFAMGGYGFYVWTSYAVALTILGYQAYTTIRKSKHVNPEH